MRRLRLAAIAAATLACLASGQAAAAGTADRLQRSIDALIDREGGPPGAIVVVKRGPEREVFRAGVGRVEPMRALAAAHFMRIASVSKAFSGAVALRLVDQGLLSLETTIGETVPELPASWHPITLAQLLQHTSGLPDFTANPQFSTDVGAAPLDPPDPLGLLAYAESSPLRDPPVYQYSNSDNIVVGLMGEAVTGASYEQALRAKVYRPFGLKRTHLGRGGLLPDPFIHGYLGDEDVSQAVAFGGWAWASGGIVSTPADLTRFVRRYVAIRRGPFVPGASDPRGPGENLAGLAIFRYETRCGTVFGHTGSILGYTQLIAATPGGRRSVTFSISTQAGEELLPALRAAQVDAVCHALRG